ncbi:MAG: phosphate ABC transporter ATP-binding protein PstB [Syntrophobacterales bacterium]|nr:phosphate ABC transporter ATP-binding protein PstB [Syntrophobacterales bacterium]
MTTSPDASAEPQAGPPVITVRGLHLYYRDFHALKNVSCDFAGRAITALIGPSGCGKSTLLRVFNRMNDLIEGVRLTGQVLIDGQDIYAKGVNLTQLRKKVGMVFQRPNPFPLSIFDNVVYGPRLHGRPRKAELEEIATRSLAAVGLWEEVKDRLGTPALSLTEEQQQRLCVARLLAVEPEILLMDEPCSALDPISTLAIEDLVSELKERFTVVIVTHNMQQAARVSDQTAFFNLKAQGEPGRLVEIDTTERIFSNPKEKATEDYISGRFG